MYEFCSQRVWNQSVLRSFFQDDTKPVMLAAPVDKIGRNILKHFAKNQARNEHQGGSSATTWPGCDHEPGGGSMITCALQAKRCRLDARIAPPPQRISAFSRGMCDILFVTHLPLSFCDHISLSPHSSIFYSRWIHRSLGPVITC